MTSLESALRITTTAESSLPELVPVTTSLIREHSGTHLSAGEDTSSSIYEVPALPGLSDQRILPNELSDAEKTEDEISRLGYHHTRNVAFGDPESGTEGGDESGPATEITIQAEPGTSGRTVDVPTQELSGRSRAILKQFFDETPPFSLPVGHPTVAVSEPQLYHLLKTLTNETLSQSFTTMEKMVLGAVRGPQRLQSHGLPISGLGTEPKLPTLEWTVTLAREELRVIRTLVHLIQVLQVLQQEKTCR